jgi:hypothetical protein
MLKLLAIWRSKYLGAGVVVCVILRDVLAGWVVAFEGKYKSPF